MGQTPSRQPVRQILQRHSRIVPYTPDARQPDSCARRAARTAVRANDADLRARQRNGSCHNVAVKRGSCNYGPLGGRRRALFARLLGPAYHYRSRPRWAVRILSWIVAAGIASFAGWPFAPLGPLAFELALHALAWRDSRRLRLAPRPVQAGPRELAVIAAHRAELLRQEALRVPSPAGWTVPAGVLPAWSWVPEPGIVPRLDRVPWWVRLWYGTPLADRYAHAWMWHHGGWDVIPATAWTAG
jgi:hypothetical protein